VAIGGRGNLDGGINCRLAQSRRISFVAFWIFT
jgi:hypothetical protein